MSDFINWILIWWPWFLAYLLGCPIIFWLALSSNNLSFGAFMWVIGAPLYYIALTFYLIGKLS